MFRHLENEEGICSSVPSKILDNEASSFKSVELIMFCEETTVLKTLKSLQTTPVGVALHGLLLMALVALGFTSDFPICSM